MSTDIGAFELLAGVGVFWFVNWFAKPVKKRKEVPKEKDIEELEEDVKSSGGVDPQILDRMENYLVELGLCPKITSNSNARTFAELARISREHPIERQRKEIRPPPAPNTMRALNMTKERLLRHTDILKRREKSGVANVFLS